MTHERQHEGAPIQYITDQSEAEAMLEVVGLRPDLGVRVQILKRSGESYMILGNNIILVPLGKVYIQIIGGDPKTGLSTFQKVVDDFRAIDQQERSHL